jgi:TM2 domain-containing membrane protein YozV
MENTGQESWNQPSGQETWNTPPQGESKRIIAGVLALLLGTFAVHKFVLGYTKEGIIQLIFSVCTCGILGIVGFIEGIIYLVKSDTEFYNTYQVGRKPWF